MTAIIAQKMIQIIQQNNFQKQNTVENVERSNQETGEEMFLDLSIDNKDFVLTYSAIHLLILKEMRCIKTSIKVKKE